MEDLWDIIKIALGLTLLFSAAAGLIGIIAWIITRVFETGNFWYLATIPVVLFMFLVGVFVGEEYL